MEKLTITKKEAVRQHRKMWKWLAKHPTRSKFSYPGTIKWEKKNKKSLDAGCFCCEYDSNFSGFCISCPLDWEGQNCCWKTDEEEESNLFSLWEDEADLKKRSKLALKIANLKERKVIWKKK